MTLPPKNKVFRIFRRKISRFFALRRQILLRQNLRATNGRPYTSCLTRSKGLLQKQQALWL